MRTAPAVAIGGGGVCRGVSAQGCVCLPHGGGVCLSGGRAAGVSACPGGCTIPLPCGQIDTCENITFPQLLLRTVIIILTFNHNLNLLTHSLIYLIYISRVDREVIPSFVFSRSCTGNASCGNVHHVTIKVGY